MKNKIYFKDLSIPLKAAAITSLAILLYTAAIFVVGFISDIVAGA